MVLVVMWCFLLLDIIAIPVKGDAELPEWQIGDKWKYDKSDTILIGTINNTTDITYRSRIETEVLNLTTLHVNGSNYEVYGVETRTELIEELGIPSEGVLTQDINYIIKSNLAILRQVSTFESPYGSFTLIYTYDPPKKEYDFPLTIGKSWTAHTTQSVYGELTGYDNITIIDNYTVEDTENVTVKAGTFECYRIKVDDGSGILTYIWYSSIIKNIVKISSESMGHSMTIELTSSTYNPNKEETDTYVLLYIMLLILILIIVLLLNLGFVLREKKKRAEESEAMSKVPDQSNILDKSRAFSPSPEIPESNHRGSEQIPPSSPQTPICPTCGHALIFTQQYNRWYCTNCEKYP
ncbi:MAG: hypothetical protein JSV09_05185 [Thermoplasmata archaeon]|nr:MAG: hypothetical protein JSV09_05185 [Thermoplasmata archaeon]